MAVSGRCDPKFKRVGEEFERNFKERGDVGATVCVTVEGETVVDLWGGIANQETGEPWKEDTVSLIWSTTKGCISLCACILASRGLLDIDAPVVKYWPEFGKHGKEKTTVKMLLNQTHSLPAWRKLLPNGAYKDWGVMAHALEEEEPWWEPGTQSDYGAITFGYLVGEVVRRISGKSPGTFFQDEVAKPLGLDFWVGLPEEIEPRVSKMIFPDMSKHIDNPFYNAVLNEPDSIASILFWNNGGYMTEFETRDGHAAEVFGGSGITNARGVAGMYAPLACGGSLKGVDLVDADTLARMSAVSNAAPPYDLTLRMPMRFTTGFLKGVDNRRLPPGQQSSIIWSEDAFGWIGFGGSCGFADLRERMSFGYTMNVMHPGTGLNPGSQALVDATYLSLGYRSNKSGSWLR